MIGRCASERYPALTFFRSFSASMRRNGLSAGSAAAISNADIDIVVKQETVGDSRTRMMEDSKSVENGCVEG